MASDAIELVCKEVVEMVTDYLGGTLARADQARFDHHLSTCPPCTAYLAQVRTTLDLAAELGSGRPRRPPTTSPGNWATSSGAGTASANRSAVTFAARRALIGMTSDDGIDSRGGALDLFDTTRTRRLALAGRGILRYGLMALLLLWGWLQFAAFEAEGIRPLVEHSPFLSWI